MATTTTVTARYTVKRGRNGRQWDVVTVGTLVVVEGGFFSRDAAVDAAQRWNKFGY